MGVALHKPVAVRGRAKILKRFGTASRDHARMVSLGATMDTAYQRIMFAMARQMAMNNVWMAATRNGITVRHGKRLLVTT